MSSGGDHMARNGQARVAQIGSVVAILLLLVSAAWALHLWPFNNSGASVNVTITEEGLNPAHIMAPPGNVTIMLTNATDVQHRIDIGGVTSDDIAPGATYNLRLGELWPSNYDIVDLSVTTPAPHGRLHVIVNAPPGPLPEGSHDSLH